MPVTEADILDALRSVNDPDLNADIVRLGFVKNIEIEQEDVRFKIELTTPACPVKDLLQQQAHDAVAALEGVKSVEVEMTAQVRPRTPAKEDILPTVRQIIAIASGKGGVGKSTVTVNLAVALAKTGAKVGLMDADVYGPSVPMMTGTAGEHPFTHESKIVPIERFGVKMMSLGYLLQEGQAPLWRGPMVAGTVKQLIVDVNWGDLDYLLVDLPPGTGDAPMTLAQSVPLTGVVIVTTPHNVAANIAGSCADLFNRLETPVLGVIENMGALVCQSCGAANRVFAGLNGEKLAAKLGTTLLGSIPLDPEVSESADEGIPSVVGYGESAHAKAFIELAGNVAAAASVMVQARQEQPLAP